VATHEIINAQLKRACEVVASERDSIAGLVELLLERDTVEAEDIRKCFDAGQPEWGVTSGLPAPPQPTLSAH
jgi:ATP-dependent Zn protease